MRIMIVLLLAGMILMAQSATIHVRELPPEPIPPGGNCTPSHSGYLGVEERISNRFALEPSEIGRYVLSRINQGYSLTLYPQASGRMFAMAQCEAANTSVDPVSR